MNTKPLTLEQRMARIVELERAEASCHQRSHSRFLKELDLEWALRYEATIQAREAEIVRLTKVIADGSPRSLEDRKDP